MGTDELEVLVTTTGTTELESLNTIIERLDTILPYVQDISGMVRLIIWFIFVGISFWFARWIWLALIKHHFKSLIKLNF